MRINFDGYTLDRVGTKITVERAGKFELFDKWTEAIQWIEAQKPDPKPGGQHGVSVA